MKMNKILAMLLSLACATGFVACDSDDEVKAPLDSPTPTNTFANYESLSFTWESIDNCIQYGYQLLDPVGVKIDAGVVNKPGVTISYLQPDTEYTLNVWAFAGLDTDYSTPPAVTLKARTDALIVIDSPVLKVVDNNGRVTIEWEAVEMADSYDYTIADSEGVTVQKGNQTDTSFLGSTLEEGDYTITVIAVPTAGGYTSSKPASINFHVEGVAELWRAEGAYYSGTLKQDWDATLIAYSDGSYSIPAFYGVEGYDLNFTVGELWELNFTVGTHYQQDGWNEWLLPTGLTDNPILYAYPFIGGTSAYSYFNAETGELGFGTYGFAMDGEWAYDEFYWVAE